MRPEDDADRHHSTIPTPFSKQSASGTIPASSHDAPRRPHPNAASNARTSLCCLDQESPPASTRTQQTLVACPPQRPAPTPDLRNERSTGKATTPQIPPPERAGGQRARATPSPNQ